MSPCPSIGMRLYFSRAGLYWKVSTWLTPPLINSEITDFARGLKCAGFPAREESTLPPPEATHSAANSLSWLNRSTSASPPIPMLASIQNFRREIYFSWRLCSLGLLIMYFSLQQLIQLLYVDELVQVQRHVSQIVQRG